MNEVERLERVGIRQVWKHEALNFTRWLSENLDLLEETTGLRLVSGETEQPAGKFSVDILANDDRGRTVIVENQYGATDHDHLGKVLTYLSVVGASAAVWIVEVPRPEHVQAVSWLNECTSADFFLVKVEAVRIGNSAPAPLLTLIVGPSQETKDAARARRDLDQQQDHAFRFLSGLLKYAQTQTSIHQGVTVTNAQYVGTSRDVPGFLSYVVRQNDSQAELYIDLGKDRDEENKRLFDLLKAESATIHAELGFDLEWDRLDGKRACRIRSVVPGGYRSPEGEWPQTFSELVDRMVALDRVLRPIWKSVQ